jgi:hypothetical protein
MSEKRGAGLYRPCVRVRVDVTGVLGVRFAYVIQSPHLRFGWRCNNNRRNTLDGRVISSAYSENDEKTRETISETVGESVENRERSKAGLAVPQSTGAP